MGLLRRIIRSRHPAVRSRPDLAERLTSRGRFKGVAGEQVALRERETVQRWLRELRPGHRVTIMVHRPWGTVAAHAERRSPINVFLSDGENAWYAVAPGAGDEQPLTPGQVEHVMLDALTSPAPPAWPRWRDL